MWQNLRKLQLENNPKTKEHHLAPRWLEVRKGKRKLTFRIKFEENKIYIRENIKGTFDIEDWKEAQKLGQRVIDNKRRGDAPIAPSLLRNDHIAEKLKLIFASKSKSYSDQANYFYDCLITPWLNEHYPHAYQLNGIVWDEYKANRFVNNPKAPVRHDRFFLKKIFEYAYEWKVIDRIPKFKYDPEKEDHREEGMVIPDHDFQKMLFAAKSVSSKWMDRLIIQRYTGMRPGEVRKLQKDRVIFHGDSVLEVRLKKEDTKTRRSREFLIASPMVIETLRRRHQAIDGPFFFPARESRVRPGTIQSVTGDLSGWEAIVAKAQVDDRYTPHDLRHTYLTQMFKSGENPALICFAAGLSLEEALDTYIHFKAEDTMKVAQTAAHVFTPKTASET